MTSGAPECRARHLAMKVRDVMNGWTDTGRDVDCLYFPASARAAHNGSLLVRANARKTVEEALDRVAPSAADFISPMTEALALQSDPFRVIFWVTAALGGLALVLTVSGMMGMCFTQVDTIRSETWGGRPRPLPAPWPAYCRRTGASAADQGVRPYKAFARAIT